MGMRLATAEATFGTTTVSSPFFSSALKFLADRRKRCAARARGRLIFANAGRKGMSSDGLRLAWIAGMVTVATRNLESPPMTGEVPASSALDDIGEDAGPLADRYRLRRRLDAGGMAVVYEALDLRSARPVAVKILKPSLTRNREARIRLEGEARATARVTHANVVSVLDFGHSRDDRPFMVTELLQGRNLGRLLEDEGPMPLVRALRIAIQVCRGLQAAHEAGVIHRDIKPENLFVCSGQESADWVKILDFGISKLLPATGHQAQALAALDHGRVVGTPHYMSPEQVCDPPKVDQRSDVYSLGLVVCEALTAERPHDGKSGATVIQEILSSPSAVVAQYRPALAHGLGEVVYPAHAFCPGDRYASAQAFGEVLAGTLRSLPHRWAAIFDGASRLGPTPAL